MADIKIQVVAFPGTPYRRLLSELDAFKHTGMPAGSALRFVQSRHDYLPEIKGAELKQIAANVQDGFVHIAAMPTRHFRALDEFVWDCRLIQLDLNGDFRALTIDSFRRALLTAWEYERRWCEVLKPRDWHHPLWLPPPSFEVADDVADYWRRCDCYVRTERIGEAHDIVQKVVSRHRRTGGGQPTRWIDVRSRRFCVDKSLHGRSAQERAGAKRFRFAAEVPMGFHYDVRRMDKGTFSINSSTKTYHGCARANVNPWGHVTVKGEVY